MNRRKFFKTVAATCAAAVVAPTAIQGQEEELIRKARAGFKSTKFFLPDYELDKLIAERRKVSAIELGDVFEGSLWGVS